MKLWSKESMTVPEVHVGKDGKFDMICPVCGNWMTAHMEKLGFGIALNPDKVHVMTCYGTCPKCRTKFEGKLRFPDLWVKVE